MYIELANARSMMYSEKKGIWIFALRDFFVQGGTGVGGNNYRSGWVDFC